MATLHACICFFLLFFVSSASSRVNLNGKVFITTTGDAPAWDLMAIDVQKGTTTSFCNITNLPTTDSGFAIRNPTKQEIYFSASRSKSILKVTIPSSPSTNECSFDQINYLPPNDFVDVADPMDLAWDSRTNKLIGIYLGITTVNQTYEEKIFSSVVDPKTKTVKVLCEFPSVWGGGQIYISSKWEFWSYFPGNGSVFLSYDPYKCTTGRKFQLPPQTTSVAGISYDSVNDELLFLAQSSIISDGDIGLIALDINTGVFRVIASWNQNKFDDLFYGVYDDADRQYIVATLNRLGQWFVVDINTGTSTTYRVHGSSYYGWSSHMVWIPNQQ